MRSNSSPRQDPEPSQPLISNSTKCLPRRHSRKRRLERGKPDPPVERQVEIDRHPSLDAFAQKLHGLKNENEHNMILSNRWFLWTSAFLTSFVATFSIAAAAPPKYRTGADNTALALTCISVLICGATAGSFFHVAMHQILYRAESMLSFFLIGLWAFILAVVMNGDNNIAISGTEVWNWNLFCSAWLSYGLVVYLFCHLTVSAV